VGLQLPLMSFASPLRCSWGFSASLSPPPCSGSLSLSSPPSWPALLWRRRCFLHFIIGVRVPLLNSGLWDD
jgi:hypothetical protein